MFSWLYPWLLSELYLYLLQVLFGNQYTFNIIVIWKSPSAVRAISFAIAK